MKVETGSEMLLNWLLFRLGPLTTLHSPVPTSGVFAASVTLEVVVQMACGLPALAVVGTGFTVTEVITAEPIQSSPVPPSSDPLGP